MRRNLHKLGVIDTEKKADGEDWKEETIENLGEKNSKDPSK